MDEKAIGGIVILSMITLQEPGTKASRVQRTTAMQKSVFKPASCHTLELYYSMEEVFEGVVTNLAMNMN